MASGHMHSLIWNHFTVSVSDETKAVCNYRKMTISRGGKNPKTFGTTNLLKHLQLNHTSEYSNLEAAEQAREMENKDKTNSGIIKTFYNYVQKVTPFGTNNPTAKKLLDLLLK